MRPHGAIVPEKMDPPYHGRIAASAACVRVPTRFVRNPSEMILRVAPENGGAKLDHRAANRSCFWAE